MSSCGNYPDDSIVAGLGAWRDERCGVGMALEETPFRRGSVARMDRVRIGLRVIDAGGICQAVAGVDGILPVSSRTLVLNQSGPASDLAWMVPRPTIERPVPDKTENIN